MGVGLIWEEGRIALVVGVAILVDAVWGEVPNRIHPVVGIGNLTKVVLGLRPVGPAREFAFGVVLVAVVAGVSVGAAAAAVWALDWAVYGYRTGSGFWSCAGVLFEGLLLSTSFAGRALLEAGRRMRAALASSLQEGRAALSHLCSRDPSQLSRSELCGATVESLAENASDSFVAPLFWYGVVAWCGGPGLVGAAAYRAVNTLDAMVGYRGKYEYLGKFAARLDDVLNWVPARLTALALVFAAVLRRLDVSRALVVGWHEHGATESPNAGWPMAVAAGALGVELTKRDVYVLGRGLSTPQPETIGECERLVAMALGAFSIVLCGLMWRLGRG